MITNFLIYNLSSIPRTLEYVDALFALTVNVTVAVAILWFESCEGEAKKKAAGTVSTAFFKVVAPHTGQSSQLFPA
jgi:hypothetical protein